MTRPSRTGAVLKIIGIALYIAGNGLYLLWQYGYGSRNWWIYLSSLVVGGLLFFWGTFLSWRGRQYGAKANAKKILHSKPDVLYSRAFRSDISTVKGVFGGRIIRVKGGRPGNSGGTVSGCAAADR